MPEAKPEPSPEELEEQQKRWEGRELTAMTLNLAGAWLPTREATLVATVSSPAPDVYLAVEAVLKRLGRHHDIYVYPENDANTGRGALQGMFGSGWANMNFTLVMVEVWPHGSTRADLRIRGAAKEGLLNQRSSEKAVRRVRDALAKKLPGVEIPGEPIAGDA